MERESSKVEVGDGDVGGDGVVVEVEDEVGVEVGVGDVVENEDEVGDVVGIEVGVGVGVGGGVYTPVPAPDIVNVTRSCRSVVIQRPYDRFPQPFTGLP